MHILAALNFHYEGQPRLSLWFGSPNHCATIAVMLLVVAVGLTQAFGISDKFGNWRNLASGFLLTGLTVVLLLTYSRGGWVAYVAGLAFMAFQGPPLRRICLFCFLGFALGMILLPKGVDRTRSISDSSDRSIIHRLEVWKGALAMTADHPFWGVGGGRFGDQFSAWYQPLDMDTTYQAAVNNYLTLSAERGLLALAAYLMVFAMPLWAIIRLNRQISSSLAFSAGGSLVAYLVSSCFTYSLDAWPINLVAGTFMVALTAWLLARRVIRNAFVGVFWLKPALAVAISILALFIAGQLVRNAEPSRVQFFTFHETLQNETATMVIPQHQTAAGVILYLHDLGEQTIDVGKSMLRPLGQRGFMVVSLDYRPRGRDGLADALALIKWAKTQNTWNSRPLYLCGSGMGGRIAILAACRTKRTDLNAVVAIEPDLEWPFPDLSPVRQMSNLVIPLLIVRSSPGGDLVGSQGFSEQNKFKTPVSTLFYKASSCPGGRLLDELASFLRRNKNSN